LSLEFIVLGSQTLDAATTDVARESYLRKGRGLFIASK
jgi:hypothetical protein